MAHDAVDLYWTTDGPPPSRIMRAAKVAGTAGVLAEAELAGEIAVAPNNVFYVSYGTQLAIMRVPKGSTR